MNRLGAIRQERGIAAADLASSAGVSRQTIYAMEAGSYVPNTVVALKLSAALGVKVEDLFQLEQAPRDIDSREVQLLPTNGEAARQGRPVQLCQVDEQIVASPTSFMPWLLPAADGMLLDDAGRHGKARVQPFQQDEALPDRLLIAGCDPGISVLSRYLRAAGVEIVVAQRNSSEALGLLKKKLIHIAGSHLREERTGESNLHAVRKLFTRSSVAVISFAEWEEGIVVRKGNPKNIREVADLARADVRMINRGAGSGSRMLLDHRLREVGIASRKVRGYDEVAPGHLPAAWQVRSETADCCIATRSAARVFGLDFIPLVSERYDLVVRKRHLQMPAVQRLFETLTRGAFRRDLEGLAGYDARASGTRLL